MLKQNALIFGAFAMLLVSGCSSTPDPTSAPSQETTPAYEFKTPSYGAKGKLIIQIPQALKDVAPETKNLLVNSVTATTHDLKSAKYCAVDFVVTYADGATDELSKPLLKGYGRESTNWDKSLGADTIRQLQADHDSIYQAKLDAPKWKNALDYLAGYTGTHQLVGNLDQTDPKPGSYISDDYKTLTFVQRCAESPIDHSTTLTFNFPYLASSVNQTFASIDMTVMKDGTLTIAKSSTRQGGYKLDSSGNWLAVKPQPIPRRLPGIATSE